MAEADSSDPRQELTRVFGVPEGDGRHQALEEFVRARPTYGLGHLYLGQSYLLNRFHGMLGLPMSVIVLGGARSMPVHASPEMVAEHLKKAEEHFDRAKELDPELAGPATSNIAALRLAARDYEAAIAYIEELMEEDDRSEEPILRQHLGIAYREIGEPEMAIELFQSVVSFSEVSLAHRNLALTYLCLDDPARADERIHEQLERHDSELDRLLARGIAAELRGDTAEARSAYDEIASACEFDGQNELLGLHARRRRAKLVP